ncbi:MAG: hypothetical protein JW725_05340 [Candidatus Babeliaceae bacterium]|nr:hypothetical protein [Candidatus Babeliaceae bacterium]
MNQTAMISFFFDRDGFGEYKFKYPIDWEMIKERFHFPETIVISQFNILDDKKNLLRIVSG